MKYTIYKNEVGQLMAMEGHCEFDGVVAKVFDLEGSAVDVHKQPETPLEHYWFNLGHQSNKIAEENNNLREKLARYREALDLYANPFNHKEKIEKETSIPDFYHDTDFGMFAREALKGIE